MKRPALKKSLSVQDFKTHYWLKSELADFCRQNAISATGGKLDIARRIEQFLSIGKIEKTRSSKRGQKTPRKMPSTFTRATIVEPGWKCTETLRVFFEQEVGSRFHFNGAMRDFIHNGVGKLLGEGVTVWEQSQREPKGSSKIAPQFEFNRHMRAYFKANPGRTHADAVAAWKNAKAKRGTRRRENA